MAEKKKSTPPWIGSKGDKEQDAATKKKAGLKGAKAKAFDKADAKMDKDKTLTKKEDTKKDTALAKKIAKKK
jgi:hypothetical protein